jgi:hypothetical protein
LRDKRRLRVFENRVLREIFGGGERRVRVVVGKPEEKRPLGRPRRRWEYYIKMDLQDVGVWTGFSWLRVGTGGRHLRIR